MVLKTCTLKIVFNKSFRPTIEICGISFLWMAFMGIIPLYNQGGLMLELDDKASSAKILWKNFDMASQHHGFVILDGKLYETTHHAPKFACIDLQTGKTIFNDQIAHLRQGQIITADGLLYIYDSTRGNVILAKPVPEKGFEEISRFKFTDGSGEHWCHPVIADKVLYIRRGDTLVAFDLKP